MPLMMLSECLDGKALTGWSIAVASGVLITCHTVQTCAAVWVRLRTMLLNYSSRKWDV